jgi:hypothetical protein
MGMSLSSAAWSPSPQSFNNCVTPSTGCIPFSIRRAGGDWFSGVDFSVSGREAKLESENSTSKNLGRREGIIRGPPR